MKKKLLCLALSATMALPLGFSVGYAEEKISVELNGEALELEAEKLDGEVYVPLRDTAEALGFEVSWDNDDKTATAENDSITAEFTVGKAEVKSNGQTQTTDLENKLEIRGKQWVTYVPAEALSALNASTDYDEDNSLLSITVDKFDGKYFKIVQASTGKVFTLENGNLTDNVRVMAGDDDGSDICVWKFSSRGNGRYNPTNKKSLRSFDIPNGRTDLGLNLIQYGRTEGTNQWIVPIEREDGTYLLQCAHEDSLYMTVTEEGNIAQYELKEDETQIFKLEEVEVKTETKKAETAEAEVDELGNKSYTLYQEETLQAVSVKGDSAKDGAEIVLSDTDEGTSGFMVWKLVPQGGSHVLLNKESGMALTYDDALVQSEPVYDETQLFELILDKNDIYKVKHVQSGLYLTVSDDMGLELAEQDKEKAQSFVLGDAVCTTQSYEKDSVGGRYYKITEAETKLAISVEDGSLDDSAKIITEEASESDSQIWSLVTQGGGSYVITNKASGRSMDIPAGNTDENVSVTQYSTNYGDNQVFKLVEGENGTVMFKNKNSGLYLTVENGRLTQQGRGRNNYQSFVLTDCGESEDKAIGGTATLFLLKGEDTVSNAKLQWNSVNGATSYDIYRSVDDGEYVYMTSQTGNSLDDYDLELGKSYKYEIYALEDGVLIDYVETKPVVPYELPADLTSANNFEEDWFNTPNSLYVDGVYYRYSAWGRDDGGSGFGRLMMTTSTDDITYSDPVEVLNYKEILEHETCEGYTSCRFESQNVHYNPITNEFVFIAHFEADGGYGTAKISFASGKPGEHFTFHGAVRYEDDDSRDLNVYVDDDNSAYIMAAVHNNADLVLYKLNEGWTGIETRLCYVNKGKWRELPNMLKVDGRYYLFSSGTAGWYPTQGMYNTATSIEGPWSPLRSVGNTNTFSAQSGYVSRLNKSGENYAMHAYRWMYYWSDAVVKRTVQRHYPITLSNGYAFYDFFDEILYDWGRDIMVPVQNGRILSQNMPSKTSTVTENAGYVNDGNYQTYWYGIPEDETEEDDEKLIEKYWPYTYEVDLGKLCSLSEIQVSWLIWNGSEPYYKYKIEGSTDGKTYTTLLDNTEGFTDYGFTADELSGSARYVRLTVTDAKPRSSDTNTYPPELYEVKVLGE